MSWNVTVANTAESSANVDESIERARLQAKAYSVEEAARTKRDDVIDAQLAAVRAIVDAVGETRIVTITVHGHINADGSGSVGMQGSLGVPVAATAPQRE